MSSDKRPVSNHPDYERENERLRTTISAMEEAVPELENSGYQVNAWDTEVDIRSKHMVVAYKIKKALALTENLGNPYFGRVDYLEDGLYSPEQLYIGRVGFNGPEEVQVIDWRAPKASVFYECQGGRAAYTVRDETYYGEVGLKRQYQINNRVLENIFDDQVLNTLTTELPGKGLDEVLRQRLEQGTDNKLKDIVETIRSEQNKVIREPLEQVTIVQGTAGSGKSTVALHRVSYLLYNNQNLDAHKVAVIAPNRLFIDYISAVIPGLDLQEIRQFTLLDLAQSLLNCALTLRGEKASAVPRGNSFLEMHRALHQFVENLSGEFIGSLKDIVLYHGNLVIKREELIKKFQEGNNPFNRRLDSLQKYVEFRIKYFLETSYMFFDQKVPRGTSKSSIKGYVKRIKDNFEQQFFRGEPGLNGAAKRARTQQLKESLTRELNALEAEKSSFLQKFGDGLPYFDIWEAHRRLSEVQPQKRIVHGEQKIYEIKRQDIAILCLLKFYLDGFPGKYQHIVIDEAQDLGPLEYTFLKLLCRNSFTILGDLAQGIGVTAGLEDWEVLKNEVFKGLPLKFHELKQSYRSTKEIVEFANRVLPVGLPRGIPVYRQGEEPQIYGIDSLEERAGRTVEQISIYLEKGCKSVAVIGKEFKESEEIFLLLEQKNLLQNLSLITENSTSLPAGITVLSIALAKDLNSMQ